MWATLFLALDVRRRGAVSLDDVHALLVAVAQGRRDMPTLHLPNGSVVPVTAVLRDVLPLLSTKRALDLEAFLSVITLAGCLPHSEESAPLAAVMAPPTPCLPPNAAHQDLPAGPAYSHVSLAGRGNGRPPRAVAVSLASAASPGGPRHVAVDLAPYRSASVGGGSPRKLRRSRSLTTRIPVEGYTARFVAHRRLRSLSPAPIPLLLTRAPRTTR